MHSYFLRPGDTAVPIVYDVDRVRDGRSFATRRVLARQHGRPIYALTASFQVAGGRVRAPGPDAGRAVARGVVRRRPRAMQSATPSAGRSGCASGRRSTCGTPATRGRAGVRRRRAAAVVRYWIRVRRPAARRRPGAPGRAHLRQRHDAARGHAGPARRCTPPAAGCRPPRSTTRCGSTAAPGRRVAALRPDVPVAAGARGLALGRLFTQDGRLVASVAQEGLIRPRRTADRRRGPRLAAAIRPKPRR